MKLCMFNEYYKPSISGGADIFMFDFIDYLASEGFEIDVITSSRPGLRDKETIDGVNVHRFRSSPISLGHRYQFSGLTLPWNYFNFPLVSRMKGIIKDCDIIQINNIFHLSLSPFIAARALRKPVVLDVHDYWASCFKKDFLYKDRDVCREWNIVKCGRCLLSSRLCGLEALLPLYLPALLADRAMRRHYIRPDVTVTHSDFVRGKVGGDINTKHVVIPYCYNGPVRRRTGVPGGKLKILYINRLIRQKGSQLIPEISRLLDRNGVNHIIDVIGDGPLMNSLRAESSGLNVNFHGAIYDLKAKDAFFRNSDLDNGYSSRLRSVPERPL